MLNNKVTKNSVIRSQKEVIQAQNILIEWLLRKVEGQRRKPGPPTAKQSQPDDFACDTALYV